MAYLAFISDEHLIHAVEKVVRKVQAAQAEADTRLHKNVLDPFSAIFEGVVQGVTFEQWIVSEKARHIQKTMQNAIGEFHQDILGNIIGAKNLEKGSVLDVMHAKKKIIAEVKNKFNTTKGNHKTEIYDAIKKTLQSPAYKNFTGYYVEIIPKDKKMYNKPFTPSDNKIKKRRPKNECIRVIDGKSFYALTTNREHALQELFEILPEVISKTLERKMLTRETKKYFKLFEAAFIPK